eukprot:2673036-Lingulodinium_polyedra.AAC.1
MAAAPGAAPKAPMSPRQLKDQRWVHVKLEISKLNQFFAPIGHLIAVKYEHMLHGVAKAQIAEDWTNTTGEGVPIQEDEETCAK